MEERVIIDANNRDIVNTSGQGENSIVPDEVANHFNWGAFFLNWIWGLGNKTYITLLIFLGSIIPILNFVAPLALCIWFGVEGNKWAWKNKRFLSIEHFHSYQKKWAVAGITLFIVGILFYAALFALIIPALKTDINVMESDSVVKLEKSRINQAAQIKKALDKKCDLSSEGLAKCFEEDLHNVSDASGNVLDLATGTRLKFTGDGYCEDKDACYVTIIPKGADEEDAVYVDLYADEDGYLYLEEENEE